ncbi:GTPase Der [Glycine soja]|nr:GTPase Der [Glycine soja]
MPQNSPLRVAVLVSGGVDSSVALRLLHAAGHSCTAFYLKIWFQEDFENFWSECPWEEDLKYAKDVCNQVDVPLEVVHLTDEYWNNVVSYLIEEYSSGRTPNPDVLCNTRIKFGAFLDAIGGMGFDYVASGHYANVIHPCADWMDEPSVLELSQDMVKDQTYFLSHLSQSQLRRLLFPLGCIPKDEVRKLATKFDLPNKDRKDSQGICFLGKIRFSEFVTRHIGEREGIILEAETGDFLGKHRGFCGLPPGQTSQLQCKVRHGPGFYDCSLQMEVEGDGQCRSAVVCISEDDQGLAAGQFAAFYEGRTCIGSGVILEFWDDQSFPVCTKALEIARMEDKSKIGNPGNATSIFPFNWPQQSIRKCGSSLAGAYPAPSSPTAGEFSGSVDDDEESGELDDLDLVALEQEAKDAVEAYSSSLSQILSIEDEEKSDRKESAQSRRKSPRRTKIIPDNLLPRVAIVGRPNVGKSALFNRLVGGNRAIVVDEPGVTRDRLYGRSYWGEHEFMVVDTGGVITVSKSQATVMEELAITTTIGMDGIPLAVREAAVARMPSMIERQATAAVEESSVIIFLVDGQAGLTAADEEIADWLRKNYSDKYVILAVNKCESPRKRIMQASEFWSLGFEPLPISAISGTGTGELLDLVCSGLQKIEESNNLVEEDYVPAISIVGRPNVGKSSILNALVGEDRTIVSPISGTTRDAIDTEFTGPDGQKFQLIDTAGIRKRTAIASAGSTTEALSVNRAFRAIRRSDVVALVIEAMACITEQDYKIAERIEKEGKGCVIVVNKWDTIPNKNQQTASYYEQDVREKLRSLVWAPIVYSTAVAGHSVDKIIVAAIEVEKERSRRLGTSILNQVVQEAVGFKPPPRTRGGKRGRVYYCTQAAIRPPTFVFFVNDAKLFPETYRRYMEKQLRTDAGFSGTPIRLLWRSRRKMGKDEGKPVTKTRENLTSNDRKLVSTTP